MTKRTLLFGAIVTLVASAPTELAAQPPVDRAEPDPEPVSEPEPEPEPEPGPGARPHEVTVDRRVRIQSDTVLRWSTQYRLRADETTPQASDSFWERVDQLPLYQRVSLDARDLADGAVELHLSAWGALDLALDSENGLVGGDVAVGYVQVRHEWASGWLGRRFVAWGIPGGLHLDGVGASARIAEGVVIEATVGRPVEPQREALFAQTPEWSEPTVAYGARVGYADPGKLSASVAYADRWAGGISADRSVAVDAMYRVSSRTDLSGSVSVDLGSIGIEQARARVGYIATDDLELDVAFEHVDPTRLLPLSSIFAAFASSMFDEIALSGTYRIGREWSVRASGGPRTYALDGVSVGYRVDAMARWTRLIGGASAFLSVGRRHDGVVGFNVIHGALAWDVIPRLIVAVQGAFAIDDEGTRDSVLARLSLDTPISPEWTAGASADWARSPTAASEVRGLVRLQFRPEVDR